MPRWLLTPRWVGLVLLLLVIVSACLWLGRWQWQQARSEVVRHPQAGVQPLVDVHSLGVPVDVEDAGRRVTVTGTFDPTRQLLVVDRQQQGQLGSWVVTALTVEGDDGEGGTIPVVRGWLPQGTPAPSPREGTQRIVGVLQPSETTGLRDPNREPLDRGEVEIVSSPELLSLWRPPLYQGYVIQERPAPAEPLQTVTPPERVSVHTDWQNLAYAIQWWLFAAFAIFWFGRMVWLESEDRRERAVEPSDRDSSDLGKMRNSNGQTNGPAAQREHS